MSATLTTTFIVPEHATTAAFNGDGILLVLGSGNFNLLIRFYQPPESKVKRAIRGLGASVSSFIFGAQDGSDCWVACGKSIFHFDLNTLKMIYTREDADYVKDIGQDDEDAINQAILSATRAYLACTTDSGAVYVMDMQTRELMKMKTSHTSIAWTAAFIPDRPNELVTGGYDCALLLFDFKLGTLLLRLEIAAAPALAPGISSLPPFITSLAVSTQGIIAAGTADGRIWIGLGGEKQASGSSKKKKKSRKWGGLSEGDGFFTKMDENLVAALHFVAPDQLISCSLHGKLAFHRLVRSGNANSESPRGGLKTTWTIQTSSCSKVDMLSYDAHCRRFAVSGLHKDQKHGTLELWTMTGGEGVDNVGEQ
ncbi:WD40 repeat-like protein [Phellopilus nigrolimitatus]|nr:WD40 repeat-like protein [Phellopilus nigrolimitatus]